MSRKPNRKYPHMLQSDVPVWDSWLDAFGNPEWTYQYDVRVGQGATPDPRLSAIMKQWAIDLSKKRIDVVIHKPDEIVIVEVKTRAGLAAIAQIVAYPLLYKAQFNPRLPIRPLLVCSKLLLDVEMLLKLLNVSYDVMDPEIPPHRGVPAGISTGEAV